MKTIAIFLIAIGGLLSGCVAYEVPYRDGGGVSHRDYDRDRDGVPNRAYRDRDRDGVPNRMDRDRDGDGVPNRQDRRPNDPRSY